MFRRRLYALRWWMISLITIGTILNYLTRAMLGVAAPTLTGDLGIGEKEYSWITGFFQIGIMLQPIAGYVMDLIGLKLGFGLFAIAWALITMLHGVATNWQMLAALRGLMGFAEGSAQPGGMKAVAEWFPAKERGFAGGFYNIGASFGSMLAAPLVAWAILFHSWRLAFVIAGGAGAGVGGAVVPLLLLAEGASEALGRGTRLHRVRSGGAPGGRRHQDLDLEPAQAAQCLGHRDSAHAGRSDLGHVGLLGAVLSDDGARLRSQADRAVRLAAVRDRRHRLPGRAHHRAVAAEAWRRPHQRPALGLHGRRAADDQHDVRRPRSTDPYVAIALLCLGGFAHQTLSITVITMSSDLFRKNEVATVAGIGGFCGNLGVLLFTLLIGGLVKTVGYDPFFVALAVFDILGAIWLWTVVRERISPRPRSAAP